MAHATPFFLGALKVEKNMVQQQLHSTRIVETVLMFILPVKESLNSQVFKANIIFTHCPS